VSPRAGPARTCARRACSPAASGSNAHRKQPPRRARQRSGVCVTDRDHHHFIVVVELHDMLAKMVEGRGVWQETLRCHAAPARRRTSPARGRWRQRARSRPRRAARAAPEPSPSVSRIVGSQPGITNGLRSRPPSFQKRRACESESEILCAGIGAARRDKNALNARSCSGAFARPDLAPRARDDSAAERRRRRAQNPRTSRSVAGCRGRCR